MQKQRSPKHLGPVRSETECAKKLRLWTARWMRDVEQIARELFDWNVSLLGKRQPQSDVSANLS